MFSGKFKSGLVILGIFQATSAHAIAPLVAVAAVQTVGSAIGAVSDVVNKVNLGDVADVMGAGQDLAAEIGDDPDATDPDEETMMLQQQTHDTEDALYAAGYAKYEVNDLLGDSRFSQLDTADKIRALRRIVRNFKDVKNSFNRLLGNKNADSLALQTSSRLEAQSLHESVMTNSILNSERLSEIKRRAKLEKSFGDTVQNFTKEQMASQKAHTLSGRDVRHGESFSVESLGRICDLLVPGTLALGALLMVTAFPRAGLGMVQGSGVALILIHLWGPAGTWLSQVFVG